MGVTAAAYLPRRRTLSALAAAVQDCRGCPLYANATQAVSGAPSVGGNPQQQVQQFKAAAEAAVQAPRAMPDDK